MKTQTFKISGMHCTACALNIDLDLEDLPGVKSAKTNYARQETQVEFDSARVSSDQIIKSIAQTGYQVI